VHHGGLHGVPPLPLQQDLTANPPKTLQDRKFGVTAATCESECSVATHIPIPECKFRKKYLSLKVHSGKGIWVATEPSDTHVSAVLNVHSGISIELPGFAFKAIRGPQDACKPRENLQGVQQTPLRRATACASPFTSLPKGIATGETSPPALLVHSQQLQEEEPSRR
jgi:hypothetical protein